MRILILLAACFAYTLGDVEDCPPLPEGILPNGEFHRVRENTLIFYCEKYYILFGTKKITCFNGTWTPDFDAFCLKKENICPPPPDVQHAKREGDDRDIGSKSFYHCDEGYFMLGNYKLTCDKYRKWDGEFPVCVERFGNVAEIATKIRNQKDLKTDVDESAQNETNDQAGYILGKEELKNGLELFLLLDRSSSVEIQDLELSKGFFKTLLDAFGVDNTLATSSTRLSVIVFGQIAEVLCELNNKTIDSVPAAMKLIDTIKAEGGGTAMEPALSRVFEYADLFRKDTKRALFLLTDGEPTVGDLPPENVASDLKKHFDMEIFAVGIGREINRTRLTSIASTPFSNHVFLLEKFQDLKAILEDVQNPPPATTAIPPPGPDTCGISSNKKDESSPWLTGIVIQPKVAGEEPRFCAGVQICQQWILTSAACFSNKRERISGEQVGIIIKANDLGKPGHNAYALEIHKSQRHLLNHPENFKLALLKLDRPVPNTLSRPVCLHMSQGLELSPRYDLHSNVLVEGWGTRTWNVSEASIALSPAGNRVVSLRSQFNLLEEPVCESIVKKILKLETKDLPFWRERLFCTGTTKPLKAEIGFCVGSLGSPLITKDQEDRYHLLGIQTAMNGCKDLATIYIDPAPYMTWINKITGNCQEQHKN